MKLATSQIRRKLYIIIIINANGDPRYYNFNIIICLYSYIIIIVEIECRVRFLENLNSKKILRLTRKLYLRNSRYLLINLYLFVIQRNVLYFNGTSEFLIFQMIAT